MTIKYFHVIGAGRVGQSLNILLEETQLWRLSHVFSRSNSSSEALIEQSLQGKICTKITQLPPVDLILITTPDGQISEIAQKLTQLTWLKNKKPLILHCSGSLSHQILHPLFECEAKTAAMHPIFAFANPHVASQNLAGHFAAIDAPNELCLQQVKTIADLLALKSFPISAEQKTLYHAALSASANFLVALAHLSQNWLKQTGMNDENSAALVHSLMQQNIQNLKTLTPQQALTGPIARGDISTISNHWQALPDMLSQRSYLALAQLTLKTAHEQLGSLKTQEIQALLDGFKIEK